VGAEQSEYDVAIISTFAATSASQRARVTGNTHEERAHAAILAVLDARATKKVQKYRDIANNIFHPLVISTTGTLSSTTERVFNEWKKILGLSMYTSMLVSLSVSLLVSRSRTLRT